VLCVAHDAGSDCRPFVKQGELELTINGASCGSVPVSVIVGGDVEVECSSTAGASVTLDGSASSDADSTPGTNDDIVSFEWYLDLGGPQQALLGAGEVIEVTLPLGSHPVFLRVTDSRDNVALDQATVSVMDTIAPQVSVELTPSVLWPPNHHMADVLATVVASDACSVPTVVLTSVTSNEVDNGAGDGNTTDDIQGVQPGTADFAFELRAERAGGGNGRVYTAVYSATDASGRTSAAAGFVAVPHDRGDPPEHSIGLEETALGTLVFWRPVEGALFYNVIRGDLAALQETTDEELTLLGNVTCLEAASVDLTTAGSEDPTLPAPGSAFFYVVGYFDGAVSSYGESSSGKPRVPGAGSCE
jgi:hypothetical protein